MGGAGGGHLVAGVKAGQRDLSCFLLFLGQACWAAGGWAAARTDGRAAKPSTSSPLRYWAQDLTGTAACNACVHSSSATVSLATSVLKMQFTCYSHVIIIRSVQYNDMDNTGACNTLVGAGTPPPSLPTVPAPPCSTTTLGSRVPTISWTQPRW